MRHRAALPLALLLATAAVAPVEGQATPPDATIPLRFDWPVGTRTRIEYARTRHREVEGNTDTTTIQWYIDLRVAAGSGRGRRLEVLSFRAEADTTQHPLVTAGTAPLATVHLDSSGAVTSVTGVDSLIGRVRRGLAAQGAPTGAGAETANATAAFMLDPSAVDAQVRGWWYIAIAFWLGSDLVFDREYAIDDAREVPISAGAKLPTKVRFGAVARFACADDRADSSCVHLVAIEQPDRDTLQTLLLQFIAKLGVPVEGITLEGFEFSKRHDLGIEPWTLLPTRFRSRHEMSFNIATEEGSQRFSQVDLHDVAFSHERARNPLHAAAAAGDEARVRALLRARAPVDAVDGDGVTPLFEAIANGHEAVARRLVGAGADAQRAERLALGHGEVDGLRLLRRIARLPARTPPTLEAARALLRDRDRAAATEAFTQLALAETTPGPMYAALADVLVQRDRDADAVALAERVIVTTPCEPTALRVLRLAHDPGYGSWERVDLASSRDFSRRLTSCAPESGEGWFASAWLAARSGDIAAADSAVRRAASLGFFSEGQRALGRWMLDHLPNGAVLLVPTEVDYFTMRVEQLDGRRPDVTLLATLALEQSAYAKAVIARDRLPTLGADSLLDAIASSRSSLAYRLVELWRDEAQAGRLSRPVTATYSLSQDFFDGGAGHFRPAGPFRLLLRDSTALGAPPGEAWRRFAAVPATVTGPPTHDADPMPNRRAYDIAQDVIYPVAQYVGGINLSALAPEPLAAVDSILGWVSPRLVAAGVDGYSEVVNTILSVHVALVMQHLTAGERARALWHLRAQGALIPETSGGRNALATAALMTGRFTTADSLMSLVRADDASFNMILKGALTARMAGRLDTSLTLLTRAAEMVANTPEESRAEVGERSFPYLPRAPGDTIGTIGMLTTTSFSELSAVVSYSMAMTRALKGDVALADASIASGRGQSVSPAMRCYVANLLGAVSGNQQLAEPVAAWFRRQITDFPCPR
jgi:hypothetical protein